MTTRSDWLIERSKSLGGSDSPNILSGKICVEFDHKFGSLHEIWASKEPVRKIHGFPLPEEKNDPDKHRRMIQGSKSEKFCREYVGEFNGVVAAECFQELYRRDGYEFMHGSIDGELHFSDKVFGLEIKTIGQRGSWWHDGVPFRVELQSRHNWFCRPGLDGFIVAAFKADEAIWDAVISGAMTVSRGVEDGLIRYQQWELDKNNFYEEECVPVLKNFWDKNVLTGDVPMADSTDACKDILGRMFMGSDSEVEMTDELSGLLALKSEVDEKYKEVEREKKRIRNEISRLLGANKKAVGESHTIYRSVVEKNEFDKKSLLEDMPELREKYTYTTTYTKLTVKRKK
tara:strand:- start:4949 stop:5980 length:1032 start_codon:yes stop_codon:yes gene_type:complete